MTGYGGGVWGKSHQIATDAGSVQPCKDFARGLIPCFASHPWFDARYAWRSYGVIAEQLGHADTRMTEKHYAHLAPSHIADTICAHFPTLGIGNEIGAVPLRHSRRG